MNEIIKGIANLIVFVVVYVPLNFVLMAGLTFLLRLLNQRFLLHFPLWAVCTASALLVWLFMFAFTQASANAAPEYFLWASLVINVGILLFIVFSNKVFQPNPDLPPFVWGKQQALAIGLYILLLLSVGLIPLFNSAEDVLLDYRNEKFQKRLLNIIATSDTAAFKKALENPVLLDKYRLKNESISLIEYLVEENKADLVRLCYEKDPTLKDFSYNFKIKTHEMIDVLVQCGLQSSDILLPLIYHNSEFMVSYYIEKHQPVFDASSDIVFKKLNAKGDTAVLNYLIIKGMPSF
jgi:hypothetical protein